jgi:DNA primase
MGVENNKGSLLVSDIKARLSLVDVVSVDVQLRRNGQTRWSGLCPFHREKTPSFTIYAGRDGGER